MRKEPNGKSYFQCRLSEKLFVILFRQSNHNHVENISGAIMLKESLLSDNFALGK